MWSALNSPLRPSAIPGSDHSMRQDSAWFPEFSVNDSAILLSQGKAFQHARSYLGPWVETLTGQVPPQPATTAPVQTPDGRRPLTHLKPVLLGSTFISPVYRESRLIWQIPVYRAAPFILEPPAAQHPRPPGAPNPEKEPHPILGIRDQHRC